MGFAVAAGLLTANDILSKAEDGVFIMFHRKSDNYPLAVRPDGWPSYQNSGEIADGVLVMQGGKMLVVAPTYTALPWSSAAVSAGGKTTTDRLTALNDWEGKANTAAQVTHPECSGASYAPGFCHQYSRTNANGKGLTAGKWWLPSLGELMMIYANFRKINYALSLINGATQLSNTWFWSSTESNTEKVWATDFSKGDTNANAQKMNHTNVVRPVSSFIA